MDFVSGVHAAGHTMAMTYCADQRQLGFSREWKIILVVVSLDFLHLTEIILKVYTL